MSNNILSFCGCMVNNHHNLDGMSSVENSSAFSKMAAVEISKNCEEACEDAPPLKKQKINENSIDTIHSTIKDLSGFKPKHILSNNTNCKRVYLTGTFESKDGDAIVILEKNAFSEEQLTNGSEYFTEKSSLEKVLQNDIYGDYKCFPKAELNSVKTTIIHPATEKHILKYSVHKCYMIDETPEVYSDVTLPLIESEQFTLEWVYNILEHKSESERIVFEDSCETNGFVLLPDLKWNGEVDSLYLLAIVRKRNIKSLRDLTKEHLPLLKNIREKGVDAIKNKYGLDSSQLRIYLHYRPSFYHLHVHFTYLRHEAPGILAEKAHLLSNVISNIELCPDYYQKSTISFVVSEKDNLFKKLSEKGILKKQ